jgi:hypothetical protein
MAKGKRSKGQATIYRKLSKPGARNKRTPFCQTRIDLAFVIDSSRSISRADFKLQMQFVNDIVSFLDVNASVDTSSYRNNHEANPFTRHRLEIEVNQTVVALCPPWDEVE